METKETLIGKMIKQKQSVVIKSFTPQRVELSDGTVLTAGKGNSFDYDILKKIIEENDSEITVNK